MAQELNKFEIAKLYNQAGDNKLRFYKDLIKTENVRHNKPLLQLVKRIIKSIAEFPKVVVAAAALVFRKNKNTQPQPVPPAYTQSQQYKNQEKIVFQELGMNRSYLSPELLTLYDNVAANVKKQFPEPEKIISKLDITKRGNFLINHKEVAVFSQSDLANLNDYLQHNRPDIDLESLIVMKDDITPATSDKLVFIDYDNPVVKDFMQDLRPSLEKSHSDNALIEAMNKVALTIDAEPDYHDKFLDDFGLEMNSLNKRHGMYKNVDMLTKFQDRLVTMFNDGSKALDELSAGIAVKGGGLNSHFVGKDEDYYYVRVPKGHDEANHPLHNKVLAIPNTLIHNEMSDNLWLTIPLSMRFAEVDPKTFEPILDNGIQKSVTGAELVMRNNFEPKYFSRYEQATITIDDKLYASHAENGLLYAVNNDEAICLGFADMQSKMSVQDLEIPDDVKPNNKIKIPVVRIADNAFSHTTLTNVSLGSNITHLGDRSFAGCKNLSNLHGGSEHVASKDTTFEGVSQITISENIDKQSVLADTEVQNTAQEVTPSYYEEDYSNNWFVPPDSDFDLYDNNSSSHGSDIFAAMTVKTVYESGDTSSDEPTKDEKSQDKKEALEQGSQEKKDEPKQEPKEEQAQKSKQSQTKKIYADLGH